MRLHNNWTVLVAIVWTILLDGSRTESIGNESRDRKLENPINVYETKLNTYNQRNEDTTYNGRYQRSKDESQIIFQDIVTKTENESLSEHNLNNVDTSTSIQQESSDGNNAFSETVDSDNYDNDETIILQRISQKPANLISLKENTRVFYGRNEDTIWSKKSISKIPKTQETMEHRTVVENQSPRVTIKGISKFATVLRSSDASMQQSNQDSQNEGIHRSPISSTIQYPNNKGEFMSLSSSSFIDNSTDRVFSQCDENPSYNKKDSEDSFEDITRISNVVTVTIDSDDEKKRKLWKNKKPHTTIAIDATPLASNPFISILLKGRKNKTTNIIPTDSLDEKKVGRMDERMKLELSKQENYIWKVKIDKMPNEPIKSFQDSKVTFPSGATRNNRISAELKLIERLVKEARANRKMQQENTAISIRDKKKILIKPEAKDLISTEKVVAHQPLNSRKLSSLDDAIPSRLVIRQEDENVVNGSSSDPNVDSSDSSFSTKNEAHEKLKSESFNSFSNNDDGIQWDYGNSLGYASLRMRSMSSEGRRRKSIGYEKRTESLTSSTKTDSTTWSIDSQPPYKDRYTMRKMLQPYSHLELSTTTHQDKKLPNDSLMKQMKREFTNVESTSTSITVAAERLPYDVGNTETQVIPEVGDVKSTETIIKTTESDVTGFEPPKTYPDIIEIEQSTKRVETLNRENISIPVIKITKENPLILDTENNNPIIVKSLEHEESLMLNGQESSDFREMDNKQTAETTGFTVRANDTKIFNYTTNDNFTRITTTLNQWPVKYSAVVEGDLVLGGLMMVHEREDSVTCGPVMPQGGVQALEAMLYTLDWINKWDLVPGVKIGAHILDDCDKDTYGLEMAVDFIKGSISNIDGAEYHCNKTAVRKVISGVVGAASSVTSIQVANLLRLFRIPQVSFFSTSPELSNKMRFEYFTRTIPSDHYQVKAMVDIVLVMGWSYVSIIYEESNYGEKAYEELEKLLGKHQICIAVKEKLSKDSGVAQAHVYDNIVLKLLTKPRARGCIIFASDQEVAGVMKAVRRCNATGAFSWIGSDGWSARSLVSDGNEPEMEGTLSVQPQANPVEGFEDYFLNLTVENNRRNPWFVEFWEDHFKCRYPNASQTPYNNYTEECKKTERLTKHNTAFEDQLQFVSDAVMAFAYAFRNMHTDLCHGNRGLCDAMKPTKGIELLSYLRKVKFKGLSGDVFHFDKNGDGPARYNIIHFKQISPGKYKWIRVGKYLEGELRLNMSEIQFRLGHPEPPESVCSLPCEVGQAKKYVEGESCCWHCFNCTQYQIRHENDEKQCVLCPQGTVPDETHSYCRDIPENFLRPESGWAIGAMSFSSTGILITLFVGGVFFKHNDTPIVRASGRELSYVLLIGILLCYLVTFALVLRPNDVVCSIQRFSAGFCFTVVYAALLTKTNRISRIFNAGKHSAKRPSFISPRSQLIICSMLIAVQILINGVWMVIDPAKAMHHYPTREDNLLVCNSYIDASYMIAFTYPIILIVVCTVYAVLTRKIPEAFNESKHIGFTMYTTCVIWLAFVPLYFGTGSQVALRITSMSVTISLSASVTIACLFTPKLYIILIHPERNVRPNMMMTRYNTTKGSVVTGTNASSMMAPVTLTAVTCDQNKAVKKHVITTIDCSTQSEQFEMEGKDEKNGKFLSTLVTRSTQTLLNNNGKNTEEMTSPIIKDIGTEENFSIAKGLNIGKIGNGPLNQNEVSL